MRRRNVKVRFVKDEQAFYGSDSISSIYEGKDKDGKPYITVDARVCDDPPEYFTKSIYMDTFDFIVIENRDHLPEKEDNNEES